MTLSAAVLLVAVGALTQGSSPDAPVLTEFRVFDGSTEVTASTSLRVVQAGRRDADGLSVQGSAAPLAPAIYDVEVRQVGSDGVVTIRWAERLAVMHYPDEGGRHLHVINLQPGYGALQLRAAGGELDADSVVLYRAGDRAAEAAAPAASAGYVLFVVPAGRYDVRITHADHGGAPDTHWLVGVDVPAGGTRLRLVGGPDG